MRLSLLLPCVIVGGMVGVSVLAQTEKEPAGEVDPFSDVDIEPAEPTPLLGDVDVEAIEEPVPTTAESVAQQAEELRRQYLQLIEQKSTLMDRSALRDAISRAEQDIDELKASESLQEARQLLLDLVKTHPETSAAQAARKMLQADPERRLVLPFVEPQLTPNTPYQAPSSRTYDSGAGVFPRGNILPSGRHEEDFSRRLLPVRAEPVKSKPQKNGQTGALLDSASFDPFEKSDSE